MSAHGVKTVLNLVCSRMVSTFMACWVTIHCRAPLVRVVCVAFASRLGCIHMGCLGLAGTIAGIFSIMCGVGVTPGVLFHVTCRWSLGVIFNMRLDVGLRDFMMGSALVRHGIMMMGVSSITFCSASRASHWPGLSTVSRSWFSMLRSLSKCLPLGVVFASAVCLVNSSVRARKC
jgi:hypothetical protein